MFKSPGFIAFQRFVGNVNEYQYFKKKYYYNSKMYLCTFIQIILICKYELYKIKATQPL